jgi:hypothetical protein
MGAHSTAVKPPLGVVDRRDARPERSGAPASSAADHLRGTGLMAHALQGRTDDEICRHCGFAADVHASHCPEFEAAMAWGCAGS